jgi:hypothetical protein
MVLEKWKGSNGPKENILTAEVNKKINFEH